MTIQLRDLSERDLPALLVIEQDTMQYPWDAGQFKTLFRAGAKGVVVIESTDSNSIPGFLLYLDCGDDIELLNIVVHRQAQSQGMGKLLLNFLICEAERVNKSIVLEVRSSNIIARQLYKTHGFQVVGERPDYYPTPTGRENAILMEKPKVLLQKK